MRLLKLIPDRRDIIVQPTIIPLNATGWFSRILYTDRRNMLALRR